MITFTSSETNNPVNIMKNELATTNENTLYVVYAIRKGEVVLETENENIAKGMVFNDNGLEYSKYPSLTYAKQKDNSKVDLYETTFLEY